MAAVDDARVTYPVRELLDRIDKRLESIEGRLDNRVTLEVFQGLGRDLQELGGRLEDVENRLRVREAAERARAKYATGAWRWARRVATAGGWLAAFLVTVLDMLGVFH